MIVRQRNLLSFFMAAFLLALTPFALALDARKAVKTVPAIYPELARKMQVHGAVRLEVQVSRNGNVTDVKTLGGHPLLVGAATQAVKSWKYEPSTQDSSEIVVVEFRQ